MLLPGDLNGDRLGAEGEFVGAVNTAPSEISSAGNSLPETGNGAEEPHLDPEYDFMIPQTID